MKNLNGCLFLVKFVDNGIRNAPRSALYKCEIRVQKELALMCFSNIKNWRILFQEPLVSMYKSRDTYIQYGSNGSKLDWFSWSELRAQLNHSNVDQGSFVIQNSNKFFFCVPVPMQRSSVFICKMLIVFQNN